MAHEICGLALEMFTKHWRAGSGFKEKVSQQGEPQRKRSKAPSTISSERSPEKLNGLRKTYHIHRTFCFSGAGAFEKQLCSSFQSLLSSLGEVLCGDEKLFRFTGKAGIVRKVTSLPSLEFGTTKELSCFQMESRLWCARGCMIRQVTWDRALRPQVFSWSGQIWCRSLINQAWTVITWTTWGDNC